MTATRIRLLSRSADGQHTFTTFAKGCMPTNGYAILSHAWGADEVLYGDICNNTATATTTKTEGWKTVEFCASQAQADGLQYFWPNTCCIDKRSLVEVQAAINSM